VKRVKIKRAVSVIVGLSIVLSSCGGSKGVLERGVEVIESIKTGEEPLSNPCFIKVADKILSSVSQAVNSSSNLSEVDQEEQQKVGQNKTEEAQECKIKVHLLYDNLEKFKEGEESERGVD
jgi:hypothetical protein